MLYVILTNFTRDIPVYILLFYSLHAPPCFDVTESSSGIFDDKGKQAVCVCVCVYIYI